MQLDPRYLYDNQKEVFVIVSGVATGVGIAPALRGYGYEVVHVTSNLQKALGYIHNSSDYIQSFEEEKTPKELIEKIQKTWKIKAVIPGAEAAVDLAEELNKELKSPYSNDPSLLASRRNKYLMHEALREAGVRSIAQCIASSLEHFYNWKETNNIPFPIVLKPLESAGTDNVFICHDEETAEQAFSNILESKNIYNSPNKKILCQEYIPGQEYMVNTVSWEGEHRIIEVLKIDKKEVNGKPLYDCLALLHPNSKKFGLINEYLSDVYKAIGLNYGAAHTELKIETRGDKQLVTLIEVGARLGGVAAPSALQEAQHYSQLSVLAKSYATPGSLKALPAGGITPIKDLAAVFFISNSSGVLKKNLNLDIFKRLKTYHCMRFNALQGETLSLTQDLLSSPGYVYLVGDKEDVEKDMREIRRLEKTLYDDLLN